MQKCSEIKQIQKLANKLTECFMVLYFVRVLVCVPVSAVSSANKSLIMPVLVLKGLTSQSQSQYEILQHCEYQRKF